jgi:hypothetical protein
MPAKVRRVLAVIGLGAALAWFVVGINWGLPSRRSDAFLFGAGREPWTGKEIVELTGASQSPPERGADVDANPVLSRAQPVVLNDIDAKRAEIVRRYRLYSHQPDEMITFNALRQMNPSRGQLDPRLYQYGGLWVYPVGALLKVASLLRLVDVRADLAFYLDHPEAFGRFYVVARLYSALWGTVGVWAVYRLVRHIAACGFAPFVAATCFATMPVVVNMAHEAKPHLPGAVLMLLAILSATNYVRTGKKRYWIGAGALCGAAFGMVLSALPVFVILPVMTLLRRQPWRTRITVALAAGLIGVDVYFLTNPYVLSHLVRRDPVLTSNLGNSAAMYKAGGSLDALLNSALLLGEGTSYVLAIAGVISAVALAVRAVRVRKDVSEPAVARRAAGLVLAAPALLVLAQFVALAAGKPGEYARFGTLPDTFLAIEAVVAVATFVRSVNARRVLFGVLLLSTAAFGGTYLLRFLGDAVGPSTRLRGAAELAQLPAGTAIAVDADPAPYSLPPVNLFDRRLVLVPRPFDAKPGAFAEPTVLIRPIDAPRRHWLDAGWWLVPQQPIRWDAGFPTLMSWAGKNFEAVEVGPPEQKNVGE